MKARPAADWRVLTGATREQRRAVREFERRVREQQREVERQRSRAWWEEARREEQRILQQIAEQERAAAGRAAARRAEEAEDRAQTQAFLAKLRDLTEYLNAEVRAAPRPTPALWRAESERWLRAYCRNFRFEPRPRNTPRHFDRQHRPGLAVEVAPEVVTTVAHVEDPFRPGRALCGAAGVPDHLLIETGEVEQAAHALCGECRAAALRAAVPGGRTRGAGALRGRGQTRRTG